MQFQMYYNKHRTSEINELLKLQLFLKFINKLERSLLFDKKYRPLATFVNQDL